MEGTVIGTYRVLRKLGEGGMGAVYLAEHSLLGRQAAIKVLQPALSRDQVIVQRFFNEARAATAIADPGIVQIFDFGYHTDGSAYIVMELLEGEPLDRRVERLGRLQPVDALRILRQVASSLAAAHARGIIHRDLKPENIYLVPDREVAHGERPKLLDFGIAKLTGDTESKVKTNTAAVMGTPMYMSPEQCRGAGQVDHRSDLYSLGCVLYHLLVGRPPFDGEGVGDIIACHLREPAPVPSASVPGIPPEVDALTLRLMAKAADQRFASATELAEVIGVMLGGGAPVSAQMPAASYSTGGHPTTLSGSAGHLPVRPVASAPGSMARPRRGKAGLIAGLIAGIAIATTVTVVVAAGGGGGGGKKPVAGAGSNGNGAALVAPAPVVPPPVVPPPVSNDVATGTGAGTATGTATDPVTGTGTGTATATATVTAPGPRGHRTTRKTPPATTAAAPQPPTPVATPSRDSTKSYVDRDRQLEKPPPRVPNDFDGDGIPDTR